MNPPLRTSVTAITSLIFGILTWVILPFIGALIAVICGHIARSEIRRQPPGTIEGDGMAIAGLVLGYSQLALCVLGTLLIIGVVVLGFGVAGWH